MIVMKFGGTSNRDACAIKNVTSIIKAHVHQRPVVVISAIAQATNMLERAGVLASEGKPDEARALMAGLFNRHVEILDSLVSKGAGHKILLEYIKDSFRELENLIHGVSIVRELTPRTMDAFCSHGELLSSKLVAAALQETNIPARWLDTKDFMATDDRHTAAMPIMDLIRRNLRPLVDQAMINGEIPVTQGFIGVSPGGVRTTMGRESSDYSATIIGSALDVDEIQIWTDVDGVLTADPSVVSSPKKLSRMSFEEAFEVSYFGAKVLHPHTMLPAIERDIPVRIFNSQKPASSGTRIAGAPENRPPIVKSISFKRKIVLVALSPQQRQGQFIFWEQIFSTLTKHNVPAPLVATSEMNIIIALEKKFLNDSLVSDLKALATVRLVENMGILSVIGNAIDGLITHRVFSSLTGIPIRMVSYGASSSSLSLLVGENHLEDAVRKLHQEFFSVTDMGDLFEDLAPLPSP